MAFIVFSLPRSRSAWLSHFLSFDGRAIGHDIGVHATSPADFIARIGDGTCETGAAFAWRLIRRLKPDLRFAVIRRPVPDVIASLAHFGITGLDDEMWFRDACLEEIGREPGALTLEYDSLSSLSCCAILFQHCLGAPLDRARWAHFDATNIQVDMAKQLVLLERNRGQIMALKASVMDALACG